MTSSDSKMPAPPQPPATSGSPAVIPAHAATSIDPISSPEEFDYESLGHTVSTRTHLIAGSIAGIMEHTIMFPFDSVKTRLQIINPNAQAMYGGMRDAFRSIATREGTKTLWRGASSVVLGAGPAHAVHFAAYEKAKKLLVNWQRGDNWNKGESYHMSHAAAGACATVTNDALMTPFDVVKQRMQAYGSTYRNVFHCFSSILRREGLRAFYVSYGTTVSMSIPFQSIHFTTYEYFRQRLNPSGRYDPMTHVCGGAIAGAVAASATTPLDVIKTLLQTKGDSSDPEIRKARGFVDGSKIIWRRYGAKGFVRGLGPRVINHMPSTAVCWGVYEYFKWLLHQRENR